MVYFHFQLQIEQRAPYLNKNWAVSYKKNLLCWISTFYVRFCISFQTETGTVRLFEQEQDLVGVVVDGSLLGCPAYSYGFN
jgi:hypothetical protein